MTSLVGSPVDLSAYPAGSRLRVLPSHASMTAAAYEGYQHDRKRCRDGLVAACKRLVSRRHPGEITVISALAA
ncbi:MAG: hypothetical protein ACK40A_10255 [Pannonibacter indicus]